MIRLVHHWIRILIFFPSRIQGSRGHRIRNTATKQVSRFNPCLDGAPWRDWSPRGSARCPASVAWRRRTGCAAIGPAQGRAACRGRAGWARTPTAGRGSVDPPRPVGCSGRTATRRYPSGNTAQLTYVKQKTRFVRALAAYCTILLFRIRVLNAVFRHFESKIC